MSASNAPVDGKPDSTPAPPPAPQAGGAGGARTTPPPLTGGALVFGTIALSLATFMNVLDTSIANVSIPAISGDLGVSPSQGTWVITSFGVANAISVPLTGWLTQRFGPVRLFVTSVVLFVIASWLCGLAPNLESLIAFRVLQGAVAGPMIPLSQTLLLASYPVAKAGLALAMWSMTTLVAPVVGPLAGGWITENISWPWIFYINVPVGLLAAAATWFIYRDRESPTRKLPIDAIGLALLVIFVGSLQVMLDKGNELDWFGSTQIVVLAITAMVGCAFFLVWEFTDGHPVVDLRLFKRRNFAVGTAALAVSYGLFFGNLVILPLWLQQWMGYTAIQAGMALAPVGLFAIILAPLVGRNIARFDPRWLASISFVTFAGVMLMRSHFNTNADYWTIMLPTIVQGVAVAFFFIPLTAITLSGMPPQRIPSAAGLSNFFRITAGSFGTSISTMMWDHRSSLHHAQLVESLNTHGGAAGIALDQLNASGIAPQQSLAMLERMIGQQAAMLGANDIFYGSAVLFILLIPLVWLSRPTHAIGAGGDGGGAH